MSIRLFTLLALLALLVSLVAAFPTPDDAAGELSRAEEKMNAQRLALGLPPVRKRKPAAKKEKLADFVDAGMVPLTVPSVSHTGYIAIHSKSFDGPRIGYLNKHRIVATQDEAMKYRWVEWNDGAMQFFEVPSDMHLCIAAGFYGETLGRGLKNFHLSRTTYLTTDGGKIHADDVNLSLHVETGVFYLNAANEIRVRWVNPDFRMPQTYTGISDGIIYYTGDLAAFEGYIQRPVEHVVYKWEPAPAA